MFGSGDCVRKFPTVPEVCVQNSLWINETLGDLTVSSRPPNILCVKIVVKDCTSLGLGLVSSPSLPSSDLPTSR